MIPAVRVKQININFITMVIIKYYSKNYINLFLFEKLCYMRVQQTHKYGNINITAKNSHTMFVKVCTISQIIFTISLQQELNELKSNEEHWHYCLTQTKIFS